jgi:hypothetical protein
LAAQRCLAEWGPPAQDPPSHAAARDETRLAKHGEMIGDIARRSTQPVRERRRRRGLVEQPEDLCASCPDEAGQGGSGFSRGGAKERGRAPSRVDDNRRLERRRHEGRDEGGWSEQEPARAELDGRSRALTDAKLVPAQPHDRREILEQAGEAAVGQTPRPVGDVALEQLSQPRP